MSYRVLLAEESPVIQRVIEVILEQEGFEIKTVADGEEALQQLDFFKPHIALMDIELRVLDGYRLCKQIKERTIDLPIPVILLAGAYEPYDEERASIVGVDDYILKPFESLELIGKIKKLLKFDGCSAYEPPLYHEDAFIKQHEEPDLVAVQDEKIQSLTEEAAPEIKEQEISFIIKPDEIKKEPIILAPLETKTHEVLKEQGHERIHSSEETQNLLKQPFEDVISYYLKSGLNEELSSSIREQVRGALYEIAPEIVEEILKNKMKIVISSLATDIEAEIKKALPDIIELIIRRKFEKVN